MVTRSSSTKRMLRLGFKKRRIFANVCEKKSKRVSPVFVARNKRHRMIAPLLFVSLCLCADGNSSAGVLVDPGAESETVALAENLRALSGKGILFGHQDSTAYGIDWKDEPDRSDANSVTGSFPAVYGWDFLDLLHAGGERAEERRRVRVMDAYRRGGVNTFSWHMYNPVTGKNFYDTTPGVPAILPGGPKHADYVALLDSIAAFALSLETERGGHVPIIFRPFHEHTGNWFWWGRKFCTKEEYIALWRFTVEYLRDVKGVHSFLYAYSPNIAYGPDRESAYLERYPGDDYVDILGLDAYVKDLSERIGDLREVAELAQARGKIPALTETGYPKGLSTTEQTDWYTKSLLAPLKNDTEARKIVYLLVWRNAHKDHFWVPYPGHPAAEDFKAFRAAPPDSVRGRNAPDVSHAFRRVSREDAQESTSEDSKRQAMPCPPPIHSAAIP